MTQLQKDYFKELDQLNRKYGASFYSMQNRYGHSITMVGFSLDRYKEKIEIWKGIFEVRK